MPPEEIATIAAAPASRLQLVVFAGDEVRTLDLPSAGTVTIGRAHESTVRIDDRSVSRRHALLHVAPKLVIEDLGGPNGTMVRDRVGAVGAGDTLHVRQLVRRKADLAVGETILLGTTSIVVRHAPRAEMPDLTASGDGVVVKDPAMRAVFAQAARAAATTISVLVLGETGVGKEVLARTIHARSPRAGGPFMAVNCAALSESLLDSELFGHEKGAFTGAVQTRIGLLEAGSGGTVFLDEVGELSPATQAKLLRVLEDRVVTRLGSTRPREIDVRFVAATHRDLEADGRGGRFRQDLYFRLNGISLAIPPLRERTGEIAELARKFLAGACRLVERAEIPGISRAAFDRLLAYPWPGNVRELRNAVECAVVLCAGDMILPDHLPPALSGAREPRHLPAPATATTVTGTGTDAASDPTHLLPDSDEFTPLPTEIKSLERARIVEALERCAGSQSQAARLLGISRRTLISRIQAFGLPRPRKRDIGPGPAE